MGNSSQGFIIVYRCKHVRVERGAPIGTGSQVEVWVCERCQFGGR
jgi:hypothetical protein